MTINEIPKYPRELIHWGRQNTTLAVEAHLCRPDVCSKRNGMAAEPMAKRSLSRFVIKLIGTQNGQAFNPMANISQLELKSLKKKSDYAFTKVMDARNSMIGGTMLCETIVLKMKPFNGKTPAAVLRENNQNAGSLANMLNVLKNSIADPSKQSFRSNNINQYNAIREALYLMQQGKLGKPKVQCPPIVVHEATYRHSGSITDKSKKNYLCYDLLITCDPSNSDYPFTVHIKNCFAPMIGGKPDRKRAVNQQERFMPLTLDEYVGLIEEMYDTARDFEGMIIGNQYTKACQFSKMQRLQHYQIKQPAYANKVTPMPQRPSIQAPNYPYNTPGGYQSQQHQTNAGA